MKISIAMATYNGEAYLQAQLDSFVKQTMQPDEIVIVDDDSSDGTVTLVEKFRREANVPVLLYENDRNLGYRQTFYSALKKTSGDLVFLSDQDDVWYERKISFMCQLAESVSCSVLMNNANFTGDIDKNADILNLDRMRVDRYGLASVVTGCCLVIRRPFLRALPAPPNTYRGHDGWIVHIAQCIGALAITNEVLQSRRLHNANTSLRLEHLAGQGSEHLRHRAVKRLRNLISRRNGESHRMNLLLEGVEDFYENLDVEGRAELCRRLKIINGNKLIPVHGMLEKAVKKRLSS